VRAATAAKILSIATQAVPRAGEFADAAESRAGAMAPRLLQIGQEAEFRLCRGSATRIRSHHPPKFAGEVAKLPQ
jgi:hypothetical protein